MRRYFIDYFQFWLPIDRKDVYDEKIKTEIKENITRNLFSKKIEERLIKNSNLSISEFYRMKFNHGGLIFHLTGKYFDTDNFSENVNQIFDVLKIVHNDHKKDFDFKKSTNTRMDIACNLPMYLNTHAYTIKKSKHIKNEWRWYIGEQKQNNLNGIVIGRRGKMGLQLSIYDKRFSPNKDLDHRFSYNNYSRLEYKIGRRYLKNRLNIGIPRLLRKYQKSYPDDLIQYCSKYRSIIFDDEKKYKNYFTDSDYNNLIGNNIDDTSAETISVMI